MEKKHKDILITMRPSFVSDVDIENIIDYLISVRIVLPKFSEELSREKNPETSMQKLLDHIQRRGPNAYSEFKNSLKDNYYWLFDQMNELEKQDLNSSDELDASLIGQNSPQSWQPSKPALNVTRKEKMNQLRDGLKDLKPKCYLALHALQGWGKSTLVGETLIDDKFRSDNFENEVYWVKFGQYDSDSCDELSNDILNQLNILFHNVRNFDHLSEPTNEDSLKYSLRKYFSNHVNALIILDHANKRGIIDAFDFGCKTLVLTTDMDVLEGKQCTKINMKEGFTVEESLELFARAIYPNEANPNAALLPKQARLIHEECKGMPLMISMYAARFADIRESLIEDKDGTKVWSDYLRDLRNKSPLLQESWKKLSATFDMCLKNLSGSDKKFYQIFSIFPEDVNITAKTLSIACGITPNEVDMTMTRFEKKALAVRQWRKGLNTYIYGIHDLMLRHLRGKLTQEELRDRHRSYVNKNLEICEGDYSKLPRDNYIYSYIGYHLKEGELFDKFSEIYLDFSFIQAKINETGRNNLLIDLKKYRKYISRDSPDLSSKVEDLKQFLIQQASTLAEYRKRNCLDIVQVALNHSNPGFVRNTAETLANSTPHGLYFKYNKQNPRNLNLVSDHLQIKISSVAFTNEPVMILVGTENGKVVWWNCRNRRHLFFYGNKPDCSVNKIIFSKESKFFISLSESGIAKLFDLKEPFEEHPESHTNNREQWTKQSNWQSLHGASRNHDESRISIEIAGQKITDVAVSSDGKKIAACTYRGYITVRDINGEELFNCPSALSQPSVVSITYITSDNLLCLANLETKTMLILEASDGSYKTQSRLHTGNETLKSLLRVHGYSNFLIALLDKKLLTVRWSDDQEILGLPAIKAFGELESGTLYAYTSAAVTRDGEYVVTADTGGSVNVYKIGMEPMLVRTYKKSVISLDTCQFEEDDGCHTICGCSDNAIVPLVYRWKFDPEEKPERTPLFDATMKTGSKEMMIAVSTVNGTVKIIQNETEVGESDPLNTRITSLKIFSNGDRVVYATENGLVHIFDIKHSKRIDIIKLSKPAHFITVLNVDNEDLIICQNGNNDLQFWLSETKNRLVENSGTVIFSAILDRIRYVITVSNTGIKLWDQTEWYLKCKHEFEPTLNIKCCSLGRGENLLAVASPQGIIQVFKLVPIQVTPNIEIHKIHDIKIKGEITACCFSSDEKMLAVGLKTGSIIIMEMKMFTEQRRLEIHSKPIKQLYWSPSNVSEPILLSLSNELAWWLVPHEIEKEVGKKLATKDSAMSKSEQNITSRAEEFIGVDENKSGKIKHSTSLNLGSGTTEINETPVASSSMNSSLSDISLNDDSGINESSNGINSCVNGIWDGKLKGINPKIEGLLSLIKLDGNSAMKVCFSDEFDNFITIDGEGSIYKLKVFEKKSNDFYLSSPS